MEPITLHSLICQLEAIKTAWQNLKVGVLCNPYYMAYLTGLWVEEQHDEVAGSGIKIIITNKTDGRLLSLVDITTLLKNNPDHLQKPVLAIRHNSGLGREKPRLVDVRRNNDLLDLIFE